MHASGVHITVESQKLCDDVLNGSHDLPVNPLYRGHGFSKLLTRLRSWNKAKVLRDLTPMITPSVEHVDILWAAGLSHLNEELEAGWKMCYSLVGPRPKTDCAVGLNASAFTHQELEKLTLYTAPNRPTLFAEHMYFPFSIGHVE